MAWRAFAVTTASVLSLCLAAGDASAIPIRITFAGQISSVDTTNDFGPLTTLGTPVTGYATWDPDTLVPTISPPGEYVEPGHVALGLLHVEAGAFSYDAPIHYISIGNSDFGSDSWDLGTQEQHTFWIYPRLVDDTATKLSSADYYTPDSLDGWTSATLVFQYPVSVTSNVSPFYVISTATITEWSVTAPEPDGATLAEIGLLLVTLGRVRNRG